MQIRTVRGRTQWPLRKMKVGQSFLVRDESKFHTARVLATYYTNQIPGRKYQTRSVPSGLRIKRIA